MIYILMFSLSAFFLWRGNERLLIKKRSKIAGKLFTVIGISLPILLASFRGLSVGRDVNYYILPYFQRAHIYSNFFEYLNHTKLDISYAFLTFIVSKMTGDIRWLFFATSVIIIGFAYVGFWNLRKFQKPWKMMLFYYFFAYNNSLCQVRQSISISLIIYAISLIYKYNHEKKGYIYGLAIIGYATTVQTGALIGILPLLVIFAVDRGFKLKKFVIPIVVVSLAIALFRYQIIAIMFRVVGFVNDKYSSYEYLTVYRSNGLSDNMTTTLMSFIVFVLSILVYRRLKSNKLCLAHKKEEEIYGQRSLILLCIITTSLVLIFEVFLSSFRVIMRLILTLQVFWPFALCMTQYLVRKDRINRIVMNWGTFLIVALYWYQLYLRIDLVGTAHYVFFT